MAERKPNRETQIRLDMEAVGTYIPTFEPTIKDLAKRERELARAQKAWRLAYVDEQGKQLEPRMVVERDSYGRAVVIENPAVRSYARTTQQANATAGKLLKLYQEVKK